MGLNEAELEVPSTSKHLCVSAATECNNKDTAVEETKMDSTSTHHPSEQEDIQTFVFIDLETSGLDYPRITELSMVAISRYDFEKMETRSEHNSGGVKDEPKKTPRNLFKYRTNQHIPFKRVKIYVNSDTNLPSAKRRLFSTPLKSNCNATDDSEEALVNVEKITKNKLCNFVDRNSNMEEGASSARCSIGVDAATDTVGLHPRFCTAQYYRIPQLPRVMHSLTRLFCPKRLIYPIVEEISGLNNILLENTPVLDANFCRLFKDFLNLPKPLCIIGHNSNRCDFPTIVAEFINATNCQFDFGDILCADSLEILKILDKIEVHEEAQEIISLVSCHLDWWNEDVFATSAEILETSDTEGHKVGETGSDKINGIKLLNEDREELVQTSEEIMSGIEEEQLLNTINNTEFTPTRRLSRINSLLNDNLMQKTPVQHLVSGSNCEGPDTPVTPTQSQQTPKARKVHDMSPSPPSSPLGTPSKGWNNILLSPAVTPKHCDAPKRHGRFPPNLIKFPHSCSLKSKIRLTRLNKEYNIGFRNWQRPFSQPVLYHRLFGQGYDAHRAEADCRALLKICGHHGEMFTKAVDIVKLPLSQIKPSWITTKVLRSPNFDKQWLK